MQLTFFSREGWNSWDLSREPLIPDGMPVLIDDDLLFEDEHGPRPTVAVNRWLRELPVSGVPARRSWKTYAQAVRAWLEFLAEHSVHPFGERDELRTALSAFAQYRLAGPVDARWDGSTWNQRITVLSKLYNWAVDENLCDRVPFTYSMGTRYTSDGHRPVGRNAAAVRRAQPHVTLKYLEPDFTTTFVRALGGLRPDGDPDTFRGHQLSRNAAMGGLTFATGLRAQEFTHLLTYELPGLPVRRSALPVRFPVAGAITKGQKARTTWSSYDALAEVHQYVELDRAAIVDGRAYRPPARLGPPLVIEEADWEGGVINGRRKPWRLLNPDDRLRLVTPEGTTALVAVQSDGSPFVDWGTVFRRTSERIRKDFEPRFPTISPHTARHTFAMATLEQLVTGYFQQAAQLEKDTGGDAWLSLLLMKMPPLMILRDLLGHSSVTTTEIYVRRLDVQRLYRAAYVAAGDSAGLLSADAEDEADAEFGEDI